LSVLSVQSPARRPQLSFTFRTRCATVA